MLAEGSAANDNGNSLPFDIEARDQATNRITNDGRKQVGASSSSGCILRDLKEKGDYENHLQHKGQRAIFILDGNAEDTDPSLTGIAKRQKHVRNCNVVTAEQMQWKNWLLGPMSLYSPERKACKKR